jgi:hypothetical protein
VFDYRATFDAMVTDPRYLANLNWGEPRPGHPEGTVRAHIAEIEPNLDALRNRFTDEEYWKLKLLVHSHDTFKAEADPGVPITHPKSHASMARTFLEEFCPDPELLAMVQYHDEPFALYQQFKARGKYNRERFDALISNIRDWDLFLAFNIIDGCTAGKSRAPMSWFFGEVAGKVKSKFNVADIPA